MNINNLPWWNENYQSEKRTNCDFFEYLSQEEFLTRLREYPLNKNLINSFLKDHAPKIRLVKISSKKFCGKIYRTSPWNSFNFEIMINSNNCLNEKSSTLIHECMHGIYRVVGNGDDSIIEKILCEYEKDFFNKNREFSIGLYKKYSSKH